MRRIPLRLWLLSALSAILQILPFPLAGPVPVWRTAFCWIALLPLLRALTSTDKFGNALTRGQSAALGYLCGALWYLGNCYWIYQTMYLYGGIPKPISVGILILFSLYLGLYHACFGVIFSIVRRSRAGVQGALLLTPCIWVAVELARARITSFPWDLLGYTQVDNSILTRLAPITGVYGISFVVAAINALWLVRIRIRDRRYTKPLLTLAGFVVIAAYLLVLTLLRPPAHSATTSTATLVQENLGVGTEERGNEETTSQLIESFGRLSLYPTADRCDGTPELSSTTCFHFLQEGFVNSRSIVPADLIAWPEAPSRFFTEDALFQERMSALAQTAHAPLVIGSIGVVRDPSTERGFRAYDSAALFTAEGTNAGRYDKIHLVPFGEYVPFKQLLFFAKKLTAGAGDMDRGTDRIVFRPGGPSGSHAYGVFICYESIFGDEVRQFVKNGAEALVNISDDGWYGDTSAAWEHLNMVRMRAIENHRWILRSTNTGVTAAIDPYGRVTAAAPRHIRTALHAGFGYESGVTFYTRHGDLFAYACALVTVLAMAYSLLRRNEIN